VIARTSDGNPKRSVVVGAHLDSVEEAPASTTTARAPRHCGRSPSRCRSST
jgi:hypothetical protein